ncbi:MAG TPA: trimethylamine methyltransferase family protein [Anaerolineales bacterium]|nr:trimethylamine methyltransferase family protein [Anaerolineales bacterium]
MHEFKVMTDADVEAVHLATLRILAETGITLTHSQAREILTSAGATIEGDRVLLPPALVEEQLAKATTKVTIRGRGGSTKTLGDGSLHWHNLGGARDIYDPSTGIHRSAVMQDIKDCTRLLDALDSVTTITPFFTPQDVPGHLMSLAMYRFAIPYTTKPLQGPGVQTAEEVHFAVRMASVIGPPNEIFSLSVSPVSPLKFPNDSAAAILEIAQNGIPFGPLPCPTAGTTAPFSIAGAVTQQNAEILASIVLAQLVHPGLPIIYCGRLAMMEPRTGISVWGGVELGIASAATVQIGHKYGLPVNVYGFSTNSHTLDIQNGFERSLNAIIPALAGADELSGIGEMEAGVTGSFAQIVCDNEIAASVRRVKRGFEVSDDSMAVDEIASAMKGSHNFLGQKHTMRYLRSGEVLLTSLAERGSWETWETHGRMGMAERAQAEAAKILKNHEVSPLTSDQERELDDILNEADRKLRK